MKTILAMTFAALAVFTLGLAPGTARAEPIYDCTNGCNVVTCTGDICSVWRCDSRGCTLLTTYHRTQPKAQASGTRAKPAAPVDEVDYVKVCPAGSGCRLYEVTASEALLLGTFDNLEELVKYRKAMRTSPAPASVPDEDPR